MPKNGVLNMRKLIMLSFLAVACAVSLANIEVDALDNTVINQYLLLKNEFEYPHSTDDYQNKK